MDCRRCGISLGSLSYGIELVRHLRRSIIPLLLDRYVFDSAYTAAAGENVGL